MGTKRAKAPTNHPQRKQGVWLVGEEAVRLGGEEWEISRGIANRRKFDKKEHKIPSLLDEQVKTSVE